VLAYIHHNPDRLEGLRLVDRRAVRNIFDAWKDPAKRSKKAQQDIDEINTRDMDEEEEEDEEEAALLSESEEQDLTHTKTGNESPDPLSFEAASAASDSIEESEKKVISEISQQQQENNETELTSSTSSAPSSLLLSSVTLPECAEFNEDSGTSSSQAKSPSKESKSQQETSKAALNNDKDDNTPQGIISIKSINLNTVIINY